MRYDANTAQTRSGSSWLSGALAGFIGTVPMTVFMLLTQRFLPKGQRYALPPEIITEDLAHRAHVRHHMNKQLVLAATTVSHFGYGATMGALYSPLEKNLPLPSIVKGALFGLIVWVASYFGLAPITHLRESGHSETTRRNVMMVVAHLIWGSAMGAIADTLSRQ